MSSMLDSVGFMRATESSARERIAALRDAIGVTIKGKPETVNLAIVALLYLSRRRVVTISRTPG